MQAASRPICREIDLLGSCFAARPVLRWASTTTVERISTMSGGYLCRGSSASRRLVVRIGRSDQNRQVKQWGLRSCHSVHDRHDRVGKPRTRICSHVAGESRQPRGRANQGASPMGRMLKQGRTRFERSRCIHFTDVRPCRRSRRYRRGCARSRSHAGDQHIADDRSRCSRSSPIPAIRSCGSAFVTGRRHCHAHSRRLGCHSSTTTGLRVP